MLSRLLTEQYRLQEGLDALQEGVTIMHKITNSPGDNGSTKSEPSHLAASLTTLASQLHDLHSLDEAVELAQEGVKLQRQIMRESPEASDDSLAAAFDDLSVSLSEMAIRGEEKLEVVQEAGSSRLQTELVQPNIDAQFGVPSTRIKQNASESAENPKEVPAVYAVRMLSSTDRSVTNSLPERMSLP